MISSISIFIASSLLPFLDFAFGEHGRWMHMILSEYCDTIISCMLLGM